jgi:hypothetical protein
VFADFAAVVAAVLSLELCAPDFLLLLLYGLFTATLGRIAARGESKSRLEEIIDETGRLPDGFCAADGAWLPGGVLGLA